MKNYGLDIKREWDEQSETDWILGATSMPCIAEVPTKDRLAMLPQGELQFGKEDFMDCASRAPLNILETKFNWLLQSNTISPENRMWLFQNGYITEQGVTFSDRFVAINSRTTRQGNSLKAPLESIRKDGLIPKSMLSANNQMTWEDYHNPNVITPQMIYLGKEFAKRFTINYERVPASTFTEYLDQYMINTGAFAWPKPVKGEYPATANTPNHAFMLVKNPAFLAFDNYLDDGKEGDFIKKLAKDYRFLDGYRVFISKETPNPKAENWLRNLLKSLLPWL